MKFFSTKEICLVKCKLKKKEVVKYFCSMVLHFLQKLAMIKEAFRDTSGSGKWH